MVFCFAFGCKCHDSYGKCRFFRFPADKKVFRKWEQLCRRKDRLAKATDRLCSCRFKDHQKENGPTIFTWNIKKRLEFPEVVSPNRKRSHKRKASDVHDTLDTAPESTSDTELSTQASHHYSPHDDHSYHYACSSSMCQQKLEELKTEMKGLQVLVKDLTLQCQEKKSFSFKNICSDDQKMLLYTSLSYDVFLIILGALQRFTLSYYSGWNVQTLPIDDQLLLTLMKLRLNLKDLDLAERFCISRATVQNIFYTFIHALHEVLFVGMLGLGIPSQLKCKGSLPQSFSEFVGARAVIDATELTQDVPSNLNAQSECYSHYKSRHTVKAVTCVAPNGALVFSSSLYPGSASDVAIVEHSKFLDQFKPGDLILADKGFTLFDMLPAGVSLNIPPFLAGKSHFTKREAELCTRIGRARIHIERANERTKNFEILQHIPSHYRPLSTKVFQVCSCLTNFQAPLLQEIAKKNT